MTGAIIGRVTLTRKPESRPAPASWGLSKRGIPWEYASAPESTDHIRIRPEYGLFIDNEFAPSRPKATFETKWREGSSQARTRSISRGDGGAIAACTDCSA